jgi:hypothetical protein
MNDVDVAIVVVDNGDAIAVAVAARVYDVLVFILLLLCLCCRRRGITLSFWIRVAGGTHPVVILVNRSAASIMSRLEAATTYVVWIE